MKGPFDWCVFHDSLASANPGQCFSVSIGHGDEADCRFEVMKLVPADALTLDLETLNGLVRNGYEWSVRKVDQ